MSKNSSGGTIALIINLNKKKYFIDLNMSKF